MSTTFQLIIILFIWVMGVKILTSEGMLLERLGKYGEKKVEAGHEIFNALILCPWCLPSIHSIVAYAFAFGLGVLPLEWNWHLLIRWPLVVMGSSFICGNAWNIYETINRVRERAEVETKYLENMEILSHFDIRDRKDNHKRQRFQSEK